MQLILTEAPDCIYGYTPGQVEELLPGQKLNDFIDWIRDNNRSGPICDGKVYDHEQHRYVPTLCGPHGMVYWADDLKRFIQTYTGPRVAHNG